MFKYLIILFISHNILAEGFTTPSSETLMILNQNILDEANSIITRMKQDNDCIEKKLDYSLQQSTEIRLGDNMGGLNSGQTAFCLCELGDKEDSIIKKFFGENLKHEWKVMNGNDNFLHGAFQLSDKTRPYDGDDRGRTFNMGSRYSLTGEDGELKINLDSTGFGKFNPQNGQKRDADGKRYLNFHELNSLSVELNKIRGTKDNKWLLMSEFSFENETDSGNLSRAFQEEWHKLFKINGHKAIQYHYLNEKPDQNTVKMLFGLGKVVSKDFGNLKCQVRIEAKTGLSVNSKTEPVFLSRSEMKLSHAALPYIVFQAWASYGKDFRGNSKAGGVELSFPMKIKGMEIKPFIGVEKYYTPLDNEYGSVSGNANERYHVFGFKLSY